MSIFGPRGRHRAPSKLSSTFTVTGRASAALAVSGGVVASIAVPQAAHATGVAFISRASTADFAAHAEEFTYPLVATPAKPQLGATEAQTALAARVPAKSYVVKPSIRPKAPAATRSEPAAPTRPIRRPSPTPTRSTKPATHEAPARPATHEAPVEGSPSPITKTQPATGGVTAIAKQFLGTPYVWGGASPSGFDCSGLTEYVFGLAGKSIPRTATAQMNAAHRVSSPQPGDLVFFGSQSYAYHVGIYLGAGKMLSAPKPGDVVKIQSVYANPVAYGQL